MSWVVLRDQGRAVAFLRVRSVSVSAAAAVFAGLVRSYPNAVIGEAVDEVVGVRGWTDTVSASPEPVAGDEKAAAESPSDDQDLVSEQPKPAPKKTRKKGRGATALKARSGGRSPEWYRSRGYVEVDDVIRRLVAKSVEVAGTQERLGALLGASQRNVSQWAAGRNKWVQSKHVDEMRRIVEAGGDPFQDPERRTAPKRGDLPPRPKMTPAAGLFYDAVKLVGARRVAKELAAPVSYVEDVVRGVGQPKQGDVQRVKRLVLAVKGVAKARKGDEFGPESVELDPYPTQTIGDFAESRGEGGAVHA